nr:galactose-1-phosphate uridylyltransferase [Candidatus Sigynarchaeota archaeon]
MVDDTPPNHRRFNPFLQKWIIIAPAREKRPLDVKSVLDGKAPEKNVTTPSSEGKKCPFCVGALEVPETFDVKILPNRFPAIDLSYEPLPPVPKQESVFKIDKAIGHQEVVLYSPNHDQKFGELPVDHLVKLVRLWKERYIEIGSNPAIRYVFEFENRGALIGVSLKHPHGQIYAFGWIPLYVQTELDAFKAHHDTHGRCLLCDMLKEEIAEKTRIVQENEHFVSVVPFFAAWPHEVHIYPKKHVQSFKDFTPDMITDFARILKDVNLRYDALYPGHEMAFVMAIHQAPTDNEDYSWYHFYVGYYPPVRGPGIQKFAAGVEMVTGAWINSTLPESFAARMRDLKIV